MHGNLFINPVKIPIRIRNEKLEIRKYEALKKRKINCVTPVLLSPSGQPQVGNVVRAGIGGLEKKIRN
jgi:hypothetical protein